MQSEVETAALEAEEQPIDVAVGTPPSGNCEMVNATDNLIATPPQRPSRPLKVRLIHRGQDRPRPAEDPRA